MSVGNLLRRFTPPEPGKITRARSRTHIDTPLAAETYAAKKLRQVLTKEIQTSRRSGAWFRIGRMERGFLGLALRLRVRLDSPALLRALVGVLKKLKEAGDGAYARLAHGAKVAWAFSAAAVAWGNQGAKAWRNDLEYARFLGDLGRARK
ncbi:MAG: hypothetical protein JRM80_13290 [Nitrososphaerota archaeon]|nr:hypothetical protein [Nitrososphaerota archaeon]MDG7011226.1 hypothetical protein [Nitrososphaerota archaeon]